MGCVWFIEWYSTRTHNDHALTYLFAILVQFTHWIFFFFSHGTIKFGVELLFVSALVLWSDPCALLFMYYVNHNLRKQSFSLSTDIMLKIINGKTSHLFFHHSWFFFFNLVSSHCHWQNNYLLCLDVTLWMQCVNLIYSP